MVSVDQAVGIVKSVATSLGFPDMIVECPKKENNDQKGIGLKSGNGVSKISFKDHSGIVKMFKRGKSTNEVMERFPYKKMQLAAVKAWVTMGKY